LPNEDTAIYEIPSVLEYLSFFYFPCSVLVGPRIGYRHFDNFIKSNTVHTSVSISMSRALVSLIYLATYMIGTSKFPGDYLLSSEYAAHGFWYKFAIMAITAKLEMNKYLCKYWIFV